ncbi:MAG: VWA domain-containing protein [Clostridia bacterium]|nr:VWA domain-containing protein [Clostridia bacterium]
MDKIAKQKLNVIMLIDKSKSMQGKRIEQVNQALKDVKKQLIQMQDENTNVDFALTIISFSTEAEFLNNEKTKDVTEFDFADIKGGGWSNLHLAYQKLAEVLKKQSQGGIMADFGGIAPIILLMTDGHPTKYPLKQEMELLNGLPWFKVALRYGVAIELKDEKTLRVLQDFVGNEGDVIECLDANTLKKIIKIVVLTASKVQSQSTGVKQQSKKQQIRQHVQQCLQEVDDWEW